MSELKPYPTSGSFKAGRTFFFQPLSDASAALGVDLQYAKSIGCTHVVDIGGVWKAWPYRYAKVGTSVAYIATDEDGPIWERWKIRQLHHA